MTFERGANLTTATTLGFSAADDQGPTDDNGFRERWPDDLAALSTVGVTAVRIALDWARLQPKPGEIDGNWAEWYVDVLTAVDAMGMQAWVTLHETAIPRWFDNDGGMDDADTFTTWWPRWVERAADRFGDHAHGWIPFAVTTPKAPFQPWKDTWGILGGGSQPVVASIDAGPTSLGTFQYVERYLGLTDRIGIDLAGLVSEAASADDGRFDERDGEAIGRAIREVAERAGSTPLAVTAVPTGRGPDVVEIVVAAVDDAIADGMPIDTVFVEPAIGAPDGEIGLLDPDRAPTAVAEVFQR
jgi:hypothetical protein